MPFIAGQEPVPDWDKSKDQFCLDFISARRKVENKFSLKIGICYIAINFRFYGQVFILFEKKRRFALIWEMQDYVTERQSRDPEHAPYMDLLGSKVSWAV